MVDLNALSEALASRLCLVDTLRAGQVDKVELGGDGRFAVEGGAIKRVLQSVEHILFFFSLQINFLSPIDSFDHLHLNCENGVAAAGGLIHGRHAGFAACRALFEALGCLFWAVDGDLGESGHLDNFVHFANVQGLFVGREQVVELLLVQLHERAGDLGGEIDVLVESIEDVDDHARDNSRGIRMAALVARAHRVRLSGARLAVGEHRAVES